MPEKVEASLLKAQQDYMRAYKGADKILKAFQEGKDAGLTVSSGCVAAHETLKSAMPTHHKSMAELEYVSKNHTMHDGSKITKRLHTIYTLKRFTYASMS